jgi:hypothetical protein
MKNKAFKAASNFVKGGGLIGVTARQTVKTGKKLASKHPVVKYVKKLRATGKAAAKKTSPAAKAAKRTISGAVEHHRRSRRTH